MKNVHVLVIPNPAQGHVIPLLEVARCLTNNGLKVTFVNTEAVHKLITSAWSEKDGPNDLMQMVSIPDGMGPLDDRNDIGKLNETMSRDQPLQLNIKESMQIFNEFQYLERRLSFLKKAYGVVPSSLEQVSNELSNKPPKLCLPHRQVYSDLAFHERKYGWQNFYYKAMEHFKFKEMVKRSKSRRRGWTVEVTSLCHCSESLCYKLLGGLPVRRNSGNGRDQRNMGHQSNRSTNSPQ
nr:UDP-glycosyltransferase 83A1-like [Tanacetum cinerariifolium]